MPNFIVARAASVVLSSMPGCFRMRGFWGGTGQIEHAARLYKNGRRGGGLRRGLALLDFSPTRGTMPHRVRSAAVWGGRKVLSVSGEAGEIPGLDPAVDRAPLTRARWGRRSPDRPRAGESGDQ